MHIIRVCAEEIVHQLSQLRGYILVCSVHIDDVLTVIECLACVCNLPVNRIQWQSITNHIILCDEYHKGFRQFIKILTGLK